jgi:predicted N-formylglutamate amidohydrolase
VARDHGKVHFLFQAPVVDQVVPISPPAGADDDPVERIDGSRAAGVLFLCDHAANALPKAYGTLGLAREQLERHIAYDIGAAWITRRLARCFGAPAILSRFSRLLIDPNRGIDDPTLVMRLSDGDIIPGNARIGADEIEYRRVHYWKPYRAAIASTIEAMLNSGPPPAVLSVHTFTPTWKSRPRPWEVGILWDSDPRFAKPLIAALTGDGFCVGDNEPYDGALMGDTLDGEVTRRGLAGLLVETRQDLVAMHARAVAFADRLAGLLRPVLARPELHCIGFFPSRTGRHV